MTTEQPTVTIGVPVYNGGRLLRDMLESLEKQTYRRFHVVICDNASTDETEEIARSFTARDPRFSYHRNPENIGAAPNFNRAYELDHSTPYYKWAAQTTLRAHLSSSAASMPWRRTRGPWSPIR
jgi:glycosyltransferase involved in cell wall biosynthesis